MSLIASSNLIVAFASATFQRFMQQMGQAAAPSEATELRGLIDRHLGLESAGLPAIAHSFMAFDHVNVQIAVESFLAREGTTHDSLGVSGQGRHFGSFSDLLEMGRFAGVPRHHPSIPGSPRTAGPSA